MTEIQSIQKKKKSFSSKKKFIIIGILLLVLILLFAWGFLLKTEKYKIKSNKIDKGLKIVFISDLHNCFFGGTDQSGLKKEIEKAEPDILIFGGDVIDEWGGTKHALNLMKWAVKKYPCIYVPGNHEEERDDNEEFYKEVKSLGLELPMNEKYFQLDVHGQPIRIYGILESKYSYHMEKQCGPLENDYYNILIAHQPEQIANYLSTSETKFDLILSGHAHAGQWRIPGILDQGLYAPDQGLFPEYTHGMYTYGDTVHIISRGLAKPLRMIFIPRIFNRPELSVIEIT